MGHVGDRKAPEGGPGPEAIRWLSLKQASDLLGVHFTTLRAWADQGQVAVFRTPGGHRRFSAEDLRRFLEERAEGNRRPDAEAVMQSALVRVRQEIERNRPEEIGWRGPFTNADEERRQRGRQLFALALAWVLKPAQHERTLADGRRLAWEYGAEAAAHSVSLPQAGRAVQFFRGQLLAGLRGDGSTGLDADDLRIQTQVDAFLDEVLYAMLEGYEHGGQAIGE